MHEIGEQPVLVRGELDGVAVHDHAPSARVEADRTAHYLTGRMPRGSTQERAQVREQFLHVEGLRHIVVGTGIKALDLVAPAVAGGQDQNGCFDARSPPRAQNRYAVNLRQPEIKNNAVIRLRLAEKLP